MANFDLRNFLTENKLTRVSKTLNESADSDEILEVINQLIEMGEEGQTALNILAKIPAWQAIVDRAVDM